MRKLILSIAAMFALSANAQTRKVDTTDINPYPTVTLANPFKPNWQDISMAKYLNVSITSDNLQDKASFHWVLFADNAIPLQMGDVVCEGQDYSNWDGDNYYPFQFVADKLGLAIK